MITICDAILKINQSAIVNVSGSDTIYDPWNEAIVTSFQIDAPYNSIQIINDGVDWFIY